MSYLQTMFAFRTRLARVLTIAFLILLTAVVGNYPALAQGNGNGGGGGGSPPSAGPKWQITVIDHATFFGSTFPLDLNQFGQILCRSFDPNGTEEFLFIYHPNGSITFLNATLSPGDLELWKLRGISGSINEAGQLATVARIRNGGTENRPVRVTLPSSGQAYAAVEDLGIIPAAASISYSINNFGEVGGASGQAAYWAPGQPLMLLPLPASYSPSTSAVLRVEDTGKMVGYMHVSSSSGQGTAGTRALYWAATGSQPLLLPYIATGPNSATYGTANDMNSAGIIVGTSSSGKTGGSTNKRAVTWNLATGQLKNLGSLGGDSYGFSINSSNNVVGVTYTKNNASMKPFYFSNSTGLIALDSAVVNMPSGTSFPSFPEMRINDANEIMTLVRLANGATRPAFLRPVQ